jgi:PAS domain S-box-containing protein
MPTIPSPNTAPQAAAPSGTYPRPDAGVRRLIEQHDWAATALGPMAGWPVSLKTVVALMLDSAEAMMIWWGPDLLQIYNDAYAPRVTAGSVPTVLGQPAAISWKHSWAEIGQEVALVLDGRPSMGHVDVPFSIERNGRPEDTFWTYTFTPVRDDHGAIRGVLILSKETTARVLADRRHTALEVLRHAAALAVSPEMLAQAVQHAAAANRADLHGVELRSLKQPPPDQAEGTQRVWVTSADIGIDIDLGLAFTVPATLPVDAAFRRFLEQFTLLVATASQRIGAEARRAIVEAERDRLLLDAPVGAAVMIGEALVYHLVNAVYATISGRAAGEMVGKPFVEVFPELRNAPVHESFLEVYRAGAPFVSQPTLVRIHRHGGALDDRYFTYNLSPLRTLDGVVYGLMVIAVDITVEVESRAQVELLNSELQTAARAKDEFLALLGHELRNPLAPIVTALELMRMRAPAGTSPTDREQVIIRRQVGHLTRLVDDLLDVSRITRGKVELRKEHVDAAGIVARAVEMVSPLIDQRKQTLHRDVSPVAWYGDPARLAQIISNLLSNASRYSQAEAAIALSSAAVDGQLQITVSDNGSGIPADLLPRIFEPFVQGERKLHSSVGGLGIGLALVKNLTELHGGTVSAHSAGPGLGSTFTVRLPLFEGAAPAPAHPAATDMIAIAPAPAAPAGGRHLLVVDDNIDAADTLARMLRIHGHTVSLAYTPETALALFRDTRIDLAILDIGLPGTSGYEVADQMRASGANPAASYIALSGFGQDIDKQRSAAAGFKAHFVKPLAPEALAALVGS